MATPKAWAPRGDAEPCETCDALGAIHAMTAKNPPLLMNIDKAKATKEASPPDSATLGRATWTLLHTMAAHYPENPPTELQKDTADFLRLIPKVYPCTWCAKDFQEILARKPLGDPVVISSNKHELGAEKSSSAAPFGVRSRAGLVQWMCEAHNEVNAHLGKPMFDCSKADERWRRRAGVE